ncbi:MAG TPA: TolC family protein [Candidatus Sulfotelmatobacter sp.]|nr:TolC family protein [Candidatus Sulfotelmatobacter sp.]
MRLGATLAVAVVIVASRAEAETRLSLSDAQAEARAHAPEGAELEARLRGAQMAADAASRVFRSNPSVSGAYTPGPLTGHPDEQSWEIGLSQTFDLSGSWKPRGASAAADRDRAAHEREDGLRALDEAVAVAVADVAQAQRRVARGERIARLQAVSSEAAHKQLEVGQGNQLDVDAADLDLAAARADSARAQGDLDSARARLARLLGREGYAELVVDDPTESSQAQAGVTLAALVDRDPRVRAADAELRAARFELATHERTIWPEVTVGTFYGYHRRDIPVGSFQGPESAGLSAQWTDTELGFKLQFPLPVFERKQTERARASGRIFLAEVQLQKAQADVRQELQSSGAALEAAQKAFDELSKTPEIIDREFDLLDKSFRAGALDAVARALALRRLQEAATRYDAAVRDLRVARARWLRRTSGLQ